MAVKQVRREPCFNSSFSAKMCKVLFIEYCCKLLPVRVYLLKNKPENFITESLYTKHSLEKLENVFPRVGSPLHLQCLLPGSLFLVKVGQSLA